MRQGLRGDGVGGDAYATGGTCATASFELDTECPGDGLMDCAGVCGGTSEIDPCGECYDTEFGGGFADLFDSFDDRMEQHALDDVL